MRPRSNVVLAGVAALLGAGAAVAGGPQAPGGSIAQPLRMTVERDRLSALELAAWLRDRRPNLTILDVRPSATSFDEFHLPRARHETGADMRTTRLDANGVIVVYGDGGDYAARAWVVLRSLGYDSVRVMPDGVREWLVDILNPTLPSDASPAARAAFQRQAELSRYFGGLPRVVPAGQGTSDSMATTHLLRSTTRRGCAF